MKLLEKNAMRTKLVREILNAKVRFFAITLVVVIGVIIFIASSMAYRNLNTSYQYTYDKLNFADFRVKSESIKPFYVEELRKIKGIRMLTPRLKIDESFVMSDGKRLIGRVTGLPHERPIVDDLLLKEGRYFKKGDKHVCIAESHFAEFYDLHVGDTIDYVRQGKKIPIKIIGVAGSPEYLVLAGEKGDFSPILSASAMAIIWTPMSDAQWIGDMPGEYNEVLFKVDNPAKMEPQIAAAENVLKDTGISDVVTQAEHQGNKMLEMDLEGFKSFALFFPILFLGIACFSIYILLSRLVYTQRPFIGVMRAMGYTKRQILNHYLSFALIIGILGAVFGAIAGYGLSYLITSVYADTIGIPLVSIKAYWVVIFQGMTLSMIFCAFAGLMPAFRSSRLDPAKAMRGETLEQPYRQPIMERVFPPLKKLPMFLKIPIRNMSRNRRRTVFTIIGLIFSVMLVLVFLATLDTAGAAMDRGFRLNNQFDMVALFLGARSGATTDKLRRMDGVKAAEPTVGYDCKVSWEGDSADTVMMGLLPDTRMKNFYTPDKEQVFIQPNHILLNQWFQIKKGLEVGDRVKLSTAWRDKEFIIGDFIEEPMGNLVYVPQEDARELLAYGQTSRGGYYIQTYPGKEAQVRAQLQKMPGMAALIDLQEIKRELDEYMKLMYVIVYVMLVFALVMAFTLTFNTITINILEREREIATMRTIGTESWKISAMTTLENVIFGLISIVPGIILGIWVGRYAMSLQQSDFFTLTLVVNPRSMWLVAIGILVILVICQIPSLRYVKKVDLATATKERGG